MAGAHSSVQTHVLAESLESAAFVLQNLNSFRVKAYVKNMGRGSPGGGSRATQFVAKSKTIAKERRCVLTL